MPSPASALFREMWPTIAMISPNVITPTTGAAGIVPSTARVACPGTGSSMPQR
jgi:hypothetical protein